MTSSSNYLHSHRILTQEDEFIQLVFFFFQNFLLLFSYLYPTFYILNHIGPAVCKRGNLVPWSAPVGRVHPQTAYHRKMPY